MGDEMTNREFLRGMDDEHLAKFLCDHSSCNDKCIGYELCCEGGNGIERWLKKAVNEDECIV